MHATRILERQAVLEADIRYLNKRLQRLECQVLSEDAIVAHLLAVRRAVARLHQISLTLAEFSVRVDFPGLTRALLTARATTDVAVKLAVTRYRDAERAYSKAQAELTKVRGKAKPLVEDYCGRFARWRANERKTLHDLRVTLCELSPGEAVSDEMVVFDQIPTDDPKEAGTIAAVYEHIFRYRDEHGAEQAIPGEVDAYVLDENVRPV